jgi:peptide/nickel transport system substrate-binding protein
VTRHESAKPSRLAVCSAAVIATVAALVTPLSAQPQHAIAMHGTPAMPPGFTQMPYVNPDAPKGGRLVQGLLGTFDSLNPFIVRGIAVQQVRNYVVESLMARGQDEPFTLYGLLAERLETDEARSFVIFHLNPLARFSDGRPVTAEDVLFSWQLLRDRGRPNYRTYYSKVARGEAIDARTVRFEFKDSGDRELPLILGLMPILPQHAVDPETFEQTSMAPPIGSGPYRITEVRPGASVKLMRDPDYWGRDLPINRGLWNFDEVRLDYFREANAQFEAFTRGLYDVRIEHEPLRWHESYDFTAVKDGRVVRDVVRSGLPQPSEYLVFNTRRPLFADVRVRRALTLLLDFEWINRTYFFGLYRRSPGYFPGSELSAYRREADAGERTLLGRYAATIPEAILDGSYRLPVTDGSGRDRDTLRIALGLLREAGYRLDGTVLRNAAGAPFRFELLVSTRDRERIALAFARDLRRAGIGVSVRVVDAVQFDQRRIAFEFDMIQNRWDQSLSPGNEQAFYWGSAAADAQGSRNYMGVRDSGVDAMIEAMLAARDRSGLVAADRALDRLLMAGAYAIPVYNVAEQWIARWNRIARPSVDALAGTLPETWWANPQPK